MNLKILFIIFLPMTITYAQLNHGFFIGPSITKNRLLFDQVEPQEFTSYEGPSYKLFYNLGYKFNYIFKNKVGLGLDVQFKKIGSDRLFKYFLPKDTFLNSWQSYISFPVYFIYNPDNNYSFELGMTSNYRLSEAEDVQGGIVTAP